VILKLTPISAQLVGESSCGVTKRSRSASSSGSGRLDEGRLRQLAAKLSVLLRVESRPVLRWRSSATDTVERPFLDQDRERVTAFTRGRL